MPSSGSVRRGRPDRGEQLARLVILAVLLGVAWGTLRGAAVVLSTIADWLG